MNCRVLRERCCGSGECVEIAPEVFRLDSRRRAVVIDDEAGTLEQLREAAGACPCEAIVVEDDDGNPVEP